MTSESLVVDLKFGKFTLELRTVDHAEVDYVDIVSMTKKQAMALSAGTGNIHCYFSTKDWNPLDTPKRIVATLISDLSQGFHPWSIKLVPASMSEEDAKAPDCQGEELGYVSMAALDMLERHGALVFAPDRTPVIRFNLQRQIAAARTNLLVLEAQLDRMGEDKMGKHNYVPA